MEQQSERLHHLLLALLVVVGTAGLYRFVVALLTRLPWSSIAFPP